MPQVFCSAGSSGRIYPRQVSIADEKETEAQPKEVVVQGHAGPERQGTWQANIQTSWRLHSVRRPEVDKGRATELRELWMPETRVKLHRRKFFQN